MQTTPTLNPLIHLTSPPWALCIKSLLRHFPLGAQADDCRKSLRLLWDITWQWTWKQATTQAASSQKECKSAIENIPPVEETRKPSWYVWPLSTLQNPNPLHLHQWCVNSLDPCCGTFSSHVFSFCLHLQGNAQSQHFQIQGNQPQPATSTCQDSGGFITAIAHLSQHPTCGLWHSTDGIPGPSFFFWKFASELDS